MYEGGACHSPCCTMGGQVGTVRILIICENNYFPAQGVILPGKKMQKKRLFFGFLPSAKPGSAKVFWPWDAVFWPHCLLPPPPPRPFCISIMPLLSLSAGEGEDSGLFGSAWVSGRVERVGGFVRFVGSKRVWVWLPERPPDPCGRCTAAGVDPGDCWHWGVDCPRRGVRVWDGHRALQAAEGQGPGAELP